MTELTTIPIALDETMNLSPEKIDNLASQVIAATVSRYSQSGFTGPWIGYLAIVNSQVVGTCGFKSPPEQQMVEIA